MLASALETVRLRPDSSADHVEQWRHVFSTSHLGDDIEALTRERPFGGDITRRWIDDSLIVRFKASPYRVRYRKNSDAGDYVGFLTSWPPTGEDVRWRDDAPAMTLHESMGMWDNAAVAEHAVHIVKEQTVIFVPKQGLAASGYHLGHTYAHSISPQTRPTARVLADLLSSVLGQPASMPAADALAIRNAAVGLLVGALRSEDIGDSKAVSDAMRQRVESWVIDRLPLGPVSPAAAAAAHGISVRSLHRLFDGPEESFGSMVRAARLRCAREDLLTSVNTVQHIAARWGYSDMSHFGREFKRTYGMTSTEFRALHNATHSQAG